MLEQFQNLLDPATTLGAFLISMISGLIVSFVIGFFSGKKVTNKRNYIKLDENSGMINIDSEFNGDVYGKK